MTVLLSIRPHLRLAQNRNTIMEIFSQGKKHVHKTNLPILLSENFLQTANYHTDRVLYISCTTTENMLGYILISGFDFFLSKFKVFTSWSTAYYISMTFYCQNYACCVSLKGHNVQIMSLNSGDIPFCYWTRSASGQSCLATCQSLAHWLAVKPASVHCWTMSLLSLSFWPCPGFWSLSAGCIKTWWTR